MIFIWLLLFLIVLIIFIWILNDRKYNNYESVSASYDSWTKDRLLETLWGEHIHLGYYDNSFRKEDFRKAKIDFVHKLVHWSGMNNLPKGSRIIDIGCGMSGLAGTVETHRPYFGSWVNYRLKNYDYSNMDPTNFNSRIDNVEYL